MFIYTFIKRISKTVSQEDQKKKMLGTSLSCQDMRFIWGFFHTCSWLLDCLKVVFDYSLFLSVHMNVTRTENGD
jgi:hypothetical protein